MFQRKKSLLQNIYKRFFFYCTVCLSVTSLSYISEEVKKITRIRQQRRKSEVLFLLYA